MKIFAYNEDFGIVLRSVFPIEIFLEGLVQRFQTVDMD